MKRIIALLVMMLFTSTVFAEVMSVKTKDVPQGTFKKLRNGNYVNYDKNGKKIGVYKISGGKLVRIK